MGVGASYFGEVDVELFLRECPLARNSNLEPQRVEEEVELDGQRSDEEGEGDGGPD